MNLSKSFLGLLMLAVLGLAGAQQEQPATVVELASGNQDFSTLVTALNEAGLAETLEGEGPFTVFAPTNAAFEATLEELGITVEELLAREDISDILTYHVVPERLLAEDVMAAIEEGDGTATFTTVQGEEIELTLEGDNVLLNGEATVVQTDLEAGNGIVHVIDTVLMPAEN